MLPDCPVGCWLLLLGLAATKRKSAAWTDLVLLVLKSVSAGESRGRFRNASGSGHIGGSIGPASVSNASV